MAEDKNLTVKVDIPECLSEPVKNLATPVSKTAGETLSDIWYLVFGNLSLKADMSRIRHAKALEDFKTNLERGLENIPEEKRTDPDVQVIAGALTDARYCVDKDELRQMFEKLILTAMNAGTAARVHPSFSDFIRRMTPQDARTLMKFKGKPSLPILNYSFKSSSGGRSPVYQNVISCDPSLIMKECSSLDILQSMGLISIRFTEWFTDEHQYDELVSSPLNSRLQAMLDSGCDQYKTYTGIQHDRGIVSLTELGSRFLLVCCPD